MPTEQNNTESTNETDANQLQTRAAECVEIARIGRNLGLEDDVSDDLIKRGLSLDEARAIFIQEYSKRRQHEPSENINHNQRTEYRSAGVQAQAPGGRDDFREAAVDAVLLRAGVPVKDAHAAARDVSSSVVDLARLCLSRSGATIGGGSTEKLIKRAMSTSDFPFILADATHKATRRGYEDEPSSHRQWVRAHPVRDFKTQNRVILGSAPSLEEVKEGAEYTHGSLNEDAASYRVSKYGKAVSLTWETLVNDDLEAFLRIQPAMGQAARRKEADVVYALLGENVGTGPQMQDGTNLFHVDHNNITTPGALSAATLSAARVLLRKQTAIGGGYMSLVPRFLMVPSQLETDAEILLASATKHIATGTESNGPKWLRNLELVVEPRLDALDAFYLAADSSQVDTAELGLLEENFGGPTIEEESEFGRDVFRWKVRHVFGAKFLDWRGIVQVPLA